MAVLLSFSVYDRYKAERTTASKSNEVAKELSLLQGRATALDAEVGRLKSDRGIEEEIRDRYQVSKKGERVVVILGDQKKQEDASTTPTDTPPEPRPWWHFW